MWSWRHVSLAAAVCLAALAAPGLVQAQTGTITGKVTDKATKQPIEAATVNVQGTSYGVQTKANGSYSILGVPPGTYTVTAKRVGYGQIDVQNVSVRIDISRQQDFELSSSATAATVVVTAPPVPLVEQGVVGTNTTITSETIAALPVTSISDVLALQQGFQEVPQNTNLISLAEERRNTTQPIRTRGSRGGSTVTIVDGTPVNNPIFGTQAIQLTTMAVAQTNFGLGYMEPQYGGGLSGIINNSVREGGERFQGQMQYTTSALAGALGSTPDELNAQHLFQGYISGPVPATGNKLKYALFGQLQSQRNRVLKFDNDVAQFDQKDITELFPPLSPGGTSPNAPLTLDVTQGWRAFGGTQNTQIGGKVTFNPAPATKLTATAVSQTRETMDYDRQYLLTYGGDPWSRVSTLMDSLGLQGSRNYQTIVQGSVRDRSSLYSAQLEQRSARNYFRFAVGRTALKRNTCNVYQGVCTTDRYWRPNFNGDFIAPFQTAGEPYVGTDLFYGGEDYWQGSSRADFTSQLTDHHKVQIGASYTLDHLIYADVIGGGAQSGAAPLIKQAYRVNPIEVASYMQDAIEYDFLTVNVGVRYDYGLAKGKGFTNPLNATNGSTAREVCNGTAVGINETPFTYQGLTGTLACLLSPPNSNGRPFLLDSATKLAQVDDFRDAKARTAFSPRIGLSFPLTEQSSLWFNAGRYTKNPEYHNLYRNSGVGTVAGPASSGGDDFCAANAVKPGTNECHPPLSFNNPDFIGNPNLLLEQSTQYELGYSANIGRNYAVTLSVYNQDQSGLTGTRTNDAIQDIGSTYNGISLPQYTIAVNQDFLTGRGITASVARAAGRGSVWGYNVNWSWSRTTENAPPPDRQTEAADAGELGVGSTRREDISSSDEANSFNGQLTLSYRQQDIPKFRGAGILKNSSFGLTYGWRQGQAYTPNNSTALSGITNAGGTTTGSAASTVAAQKNSGRGPAQQTANLQYRKDLALGNARYGIVVRVNNIFNIQNCLQVFNNTGTCSTGTREFAQRRVGNSSGNSSTQLDSPQFRTDTRRISSGVTITF